jgi:hypothetical protein
MQLHFNDICNKLERTLFWNSKGILTFCSKKLDLKNAWLCKQDQITEHKGYCFK